MTIRRRYALLSAAMVMLVLGACDPFNTGFEDIQPAVEYTAASVKSAPSAPDELLVRAQDAGPELAPHLVEIALRDHRGELEVRAVALALVLDARFDRLDVAGREREEALDVEADVARACPAALVARRPQAFGVVLGRDRRHVVDADLQLLTVGETLQVVRRGLDVAEGGLDEIHARLVETDRTRLVDAMRTVARLITAGLVSIAVEDPDGAAARHCLESYDAERDDRFDTGFDVGAARPVGVDDLRPPDGLLLVARLRETPVGCGALKLVDPAFAEIKRVWVDGSARGLGLGRRLLAALEAEDPLK